MKSLLIIGQPRGFTTNVYNYSLQATGLKKTLAKGGEILNRDNGKYFGWPHFVSDAESYAAARNLLELFAEDYVIKDVVNPHLILRYLDERPNAYNVLHVFREPEECQRHQRARGWAKVDPTSYLERFRKFRTVHFKDLIRSSTSLWDALCDLGYPVRRFNYITPQFILKRHNVLRREAK